MLKSVLAQQSKQNLVEAQIDYQSKGMKHMAPQLQLLTKTTKEVVESNLRMQWEQNELKNRMALLQASHRITERKDKELQWPVQYYSKDELFWDGTRYKGWTTMELNE